jgi:hypothetical protein
LDDADEEDAVAFPLGYASDGNNVEDGVERVALLSVLGWYSSDNDEGT